MNTRTHKLVHFNLVILNSLILKTRLKRIAPMAPAASHAITNFCIPPTSHQTQSSSPLNFNVARFSRIIPVMFSACWTGCVSSTKQATDNLILQMILNHESLQKWVQHAESKRNSNVWSNETGNTVENFIIIIYEAEHHTLVLVISGTK